METRHCDHLLFSHLSQLLLTSRCFHYGNWHILQWERFRRVLDMPYTQRLAFVILFDRQRVDLHMVIKGGHVRGVWNPRCENEWPAFRAAVSPFSSPLRLLGILVLQSCLSDKFYSFSKRGFKNHFTFCSHVVTEGHGDAHVEVSLLSQCCWPRDTLQLGPCRSEWSRLLPDEMMTLGTEGQSWGPCLDPLPYCSQGQCWCLRFLLPWKTMQMFKIWSKTSDQRPCCCCGHVNLRDLHYHLGQWWHPDPDAAEDHVWVHGSTAASVCVSPKITQKTVVGVQPVVLLVSWRYAQHQSHPHVSGLCLHPEPGCHPVPSCCRGSWLVLWSCCS